MTDPEELIVLCKNLSAQLQDVLDIAIEEITSSASLSYCDDVNSQHWVRNSRKLIEQANNIEED